MISCWDLCSGKIQNRLKFATRYLYSKDQCPRNWTSYFLYLPSLLTDLSWLRSTKLSFRCFISWRKKSSLPDKKGKDDAVSDNYQFIFSRSLIQFLFLPVSQNFDVGVEMWWGVAPECSGLISRCVRRFMWHVLWHFAYWTFEKKSLQIQAMSDN